MTGLGSILLAAMVTEDSSKEWNGGGRRGEPLGIIGTVEGVIGVGAMLFDSRPHHHYQPPLQILTEEPDTERIQDWTSNHIIKELVRHLETSTYVLNYPQPIHDMGDSGYREYTIDFDWLAEPVRKLFETIEQLEKSDDTIDKMVSLIEKTLSDITRKESNWYEEYANIKSWGDELARFNGAKELRFKYCSPEGRSQNPKVPRLVQAIDTLGEYAKKEPTLIKSCLDYVTRTKDYITPQLIQNYDTRTIELVLEAAIKADEITHQTDEPIQKAKPLYQRWGRNNTPKRFTLRDRMKKLIAYHTSQGSSDKEMRAVFRVAIDTMELKGTIEEPYRIIEHREAIPKTRTKLREYIGVGAIALGLTLGIAAIGGTIRSGDRSPQEYAGEGQGIESVIETSRGVVQTITDSLLRTGESLNETVKGYIFGEQ